MTDHITKTKRLVCGVGVNDAKYEVATLVNGRQQWCHFYITWRNMLKRAYDSKYKKNCPTYDGVTVCEEWKIFSSFRSWMEKQEWQGHVLDKDLLVPGNKIYSPDTCLFVTSSINAITTTRKKKRGEYPIGVHKCFGKYKASCRVGSRRITIGTFDTPDEAHRAYVEAKRKYVETLAAEQKDEKLKAALINYASFVEHVK